MKNIIPLKKEFKFKTNISEITSISLEHHLSIDENDVNGEFIVSGDYKASDNSKTVIPFDINIPFSIVIDSIYDTSKALVDVDDFYYEIVNNDTLLISIDVCIDKLVEILLPDLDIKKDVIEGINDDLLEEVINKPVIEAKIENERCIEEDDILPGEEVDNNDEVKDNVINNLEENKTEKVEKSIKEEKVIEKSNNIEDKKIIPNSIFGNIKDSDIYVSYNVYIIREGDTIESIIEKYDADLEEVKQYNDLSNLKLGDKIIIPAK